MQKTFSIRIYDKKIDDFITEEAKKKDRKRNYIINQMLKEVYELRIKELVSVSVSQKTKSKSVDKIERGHSVWPK